MYSLSAFIKKNEEIYCTAMIDLTNEISLKEAIEMTKYTPKEKIVLYEEDGLNKREILTINIINGEYYIKIQP